MMSIYKCYIGERLICEVEAKNSNGAITLAKKSYTVRMSDSWEWRTKKIK